MDLQQTWAQVQALPLGDQQTILENLMESLHGSVYVFEPELDEEFAAELERRVEADLANPQGRITLEEFKAQYMKSKK